jgi:preprotein translocase subunit SecF
MRINVFGAMAIVFLYLMISYRKWQYSLGAIAAVAHVMLFCIRYLFFMLQIYAFRNGD